MKSRHKEGVGGYCFLYLYKRRFLWGGGMGVGNYLGRCLWHPWLYVIHLNDIKIVLSVKIEWDFKKWMIFFDMKEIESGATSNTAVRYLFGK